MASGSGSINALKVPVKLLHVNETQYTTKWSQQTYSYYHMFDHGVTLAVPREGNLGTYDFKKWKDKAVALTYNIKNKGLLAGRTEMVRIANEEYGLTVPGRKFLIINVKISTTFFVLLVIKIGIIIPFQKIPVMQNHYLFGKMHLIDVI